MFTPYHKSVEQISSQLLVRRLEMKTLNLLLPEEKVWAVLVSLARTFWG